MKTREYLLDPSVATQNLQTTVYFLTSGDKSVSKNGQPVIHYISGLNLWILKLATFTLQNMKRIALGSLYGMHVCKWNLHKGKPTNL